MTYGAVITCIIITVIILAFAGIIGYLEEYKGKFDVDYSSERIMFDDDNSKRHVIYFKSGTIIVDEIKE